MRNCILSGLCPLVMIDSNEHVKLDGVAKSAHVLFAGAYCCHLALLVDLHLMGFIKPNTTKLSYGKLDTCKSCNVAQSIFEYASMVTSLTTELFPERCKRHIKEAISLKPSLTQQKVRSNGNCSEK